MTKRRMTIGDDVRAGMITFDGDAIKAESSLRYMSEVIRSVRSAVSFRADNVSDYVGEKEEFNLADSVPTMAPQFDEMWFEYPMPKDSGTEVGVLISSRRVSSDEKTQQVARRWMQSQNTVGTHPVTIDDVAGWTFRASVFIKAHGITIYPHAFTALLGPDGLPCNIHETEAQSFLMTALEACPIDLDIDYSVCAGTPALLAIAFMHCKNVGVSDFQISRHEFRERTRRNDPIVKYKTLTIEPMKKVLATEGGIAENGLKKALHICRGHFSNYSEDKPLFGKYSGQFWIPSHVRGSADSGKVIKNYVVKAPKADAA